MVVEQPSINNIMCGLENTGGVKQHNHKKKLKQRFDLIKKLGQGTFGKVQLGINKETGQEVAIKTIKKSKIGSEADLIRIRREIQIMSSVQHPNIIHIYEVFENREKMVLVMEYAAGGELYDYLSQRKVLQEEEARRIFRQIATACYYCHKHKICHRDLKLENILLDENNNAKIADFGLSNVFDDQRLLDTFCGSPLYASPEIVKGTPYQGPEVDCWSMGVLLYTLVYGAMPFDGSNFKRLVKQISQGDYYEPSTPSRASPLIREMLAVNPKHRANIEQICAHWWVNEGYSENCYDESEDLANQTPVRLDLLLSLAPPPQLDNDKLVVTGEVAAEVAEAGPARSQSMGSIMDLARSETERRLRIEDNKATKRKLTGTVSTDRANVDPQRKDKIIKENTVADITVHGALIEEGEIPLNKSLTQTLSTEMDVEQPETQEAFDDSLEGAACAEILEEQAKKVDRKPLKLKKNLTSTLSPTLEGITETPSQENLTSKDKENVEVQAISAPTTPTKEPAEKAPSPKKKIVKKKVLSDKSENVVKPKSPSRDKKSPTAQSVPKKDEEKKEETVEVPVGRRRSRIFEAAEKFQNLMSPEAKPAVVEKPKKIIIPGVSVDGFKKEFERKASITSTSPPKLSSGAMRRRTSTQTSIDEPMSPEEAPKIPTVEKEVKPVESVETPETHAPEAETKIPDRVEQVRNAVSIISSALDKEGARKSKSRPCMMRKPPVPFGVSGRSASGNIGMLSSSLNAPLGPRPFVKAQMEKAQVQKIEPEPEPTEESKVSSAEITLKSATLPRRKTTKAEIQLNYPVPKPASTTMEFKTEMAHPVLAQSKPKYETQRSEVVMPVSAQPKIGLRSASLEPENIKATPKERIIPIAFEKPSSNVSESPQSPPPKPPVHRVFQNQKSNISQRANSLSRQSTLESDTDTVTSTGEPIRKSPREYIIPIAVEGGGYVTPRAGSLEPSETTSSASTLTNKSRSAFGRAKRLNSRMSDRDSEDESPFTNLHRHSSFGKDSDTEEGRARDAFAMHRLRSTRPKKATVEHADSVSSGEDDDDDGFDILTAENLFSTLLSRVRDLTQRLNVEDGGRPGFPSSRLLSHFDTGIWNFHNRMDPFSRHSSLGRSFSRDRGVESPRSALGGPQWRRSTSRDTEADRFPEEKSSAQPRGDKNAKKKENLNLADLDLKKLKLSNEDALTLSYLTPALTRRIQKQLLAQLAPSEVRKLHRTLSSRNYTENKDELDSRALGRRSADRISSGTPKHQYDLNRDYITSNTEKKKSYLPTKNRSYRVGQENIPEYETDTNRQSKIPGYPSRNYSFNKNDSNLLSPDSSVSESISSSYNKDSISELDSKTFSTDSLSSLARPPSYSKYDPSFSKYLNQNKANTTRDTKVEPVSLRPSNSQKRISRFLRPDFFDVPKEESVFVKEKQSKECETQKVLKEIRDKRRERLRRDRSLSKENSQIKVEEIKAPETPVILVQSEPFATNSEVTTNGIHDYVNVTLSTNEIDTKPVETTEQVQTMKQVQTMPQIETVPQTETVQPVVLKKERTSRLARPKSYPSGTTPELTVVNPTESKISRLRKGFVRKDSKEKTKDDKNELNKTINEEEKATKNKLLQSIEKKLEKFKTNNENAKLKQSKSTVENAIRKLREQSLPKNLEQCTESGLIKRAVSVEDLPNMGKPLIASRKSVTKILGLFKKYEEKEAKADKTVKKKKSKDIENNVEPTILPEPQITNGTVKKERPKSVAFESQCTPSLSQTDVINNNVSLTHDYQNVPNLNNTNEWNQPTLNGAKSEPKLSDKKVSKLPVNSFRRSLNLDNLPEPPKLKIPSKFTPATSSDVENKVDRRKLRLDFSKLPTTSTRTEPRIIEPLPGTSHDNILLSKRNSTISNSSFLSPCEDYSDTWSICSDYHSHDLHSPVSPNGNLYSGDENDSVIDRIRRKSFYTRFNDNKKRPPRKSNVVKNYRDLDLYKDSSHSDVYGSLDRRPSYDYRSPSLSRRSSFTSAGQNEPKKTYKTYTRSSSLMNDYVNVPNKYQTYSSRIGRPCSYLHSDTEGALDEQISNRAKTYVSTTTPSSRLKRYSVTPVREDYNSNRAPSTFSRYSRSSASQEPL